MAETQEIIRIPMQLGSEFRITRSGELKVSNPEMELEPSEAAADAVLAYWFDRDTQEHVIGLIKPLSFAPRR